MTQDSPNNPTSGSDVFVSYASQDAAVANSIVESLEKHGLKCWIAPRDVKPGAQYADAIVRAITEAEAVVLVMSASAVGSSHVAREVERAASKHKPIIPFRVDTWALNPELEYFLSNSQWIDVPKLGMPAALAKLQEAVGRGFAAPSQDAAAAKPAGGSKKRIIIAAAIVIGVGGAVAVGRYFWKLNQINAQAPAPAGQSAPATAFNPPPHSIAVLPFVNMSGDKDQEYFSDGLTEELLNSLAEINELQVAARTSAFSFKGKDTDIGTIARKLNVGAVLEGSVRRSARTIRVTAQLNNAVTGFHLWSKTYDRDLGDVLKLQTEIATAVASALKVTLLGDVAAKVELGGTRNPAAFDAYLRGAKAYSSSHDAKDLPTAIGAYTEAIRLDPHYALAFAGRSIALSYAAGRAETEAAVREGFDRAQADARQGLNLAPDLAQAHLALASVSEYTLNFTQASEAYERALALAPGNAEVLRNSGSFEVWMGHFDAGVAAARRAVVLDPLARESHYYLGWALYFARRYEEAAAVFAEVTSLDPEFGEAYVFRGLSYYGLGDLQRSRATCETRPDFWASPWCLAVTYDKLGRHADAEAMLSKLKAAMGDTAAYQYVTIYAQWGNRAQALTSLDTAMRVRDPALLFLKTDRLLDPIRQEPRFQAIERELKFPD
jgi:TolB-like protein/tetratricopeptide (TPR) repeat protein